MSIRASLYVLLLLALLPLVSVEVYNSLLDRRLSVEALQAEARDESIRLAGELGRLVEGAEHLLRSLAHSSAVQARDRARCNEYLSGLRAAMNGPAGIGVADLDGNVFCLSRDLTKPINIADRRYFQDAVAQRALSIGEYVIGRKGGVPAIHFGLPVLDGGRVTGVVFVPLSLDWMNRELASRPWPQGAVVRVTDVNGVVVAAYPRTSDVGQRLDRLTRDGVRNVVVATSPIRQSGERLSVWIAVPTADTLRRIDEASLRAALWLLGSVLLGLLLAELISRKLVHQPLRQLQQVAEKLEAGRFDARPEMSHRVPEFARLADAFERLATELQLRQAADVEAQEQLKRARDDALAANASKTAFLSSVSHDLRQPLQAMGLATLLLKTKVDGPLAISLVERLARSAENLTDLVNALLEVSELDSGLIRPVVRDFSVTSLWQRATEDFVDAAAAKQIRVVAVPSDETIRSDPRLLARMVQNALSNALKYTPPEGTVTLRAVPVDGQLELSIADNGPGIPVQSQSEVWEEFRQLANPERDPRKGLGLGMAIIKRMAGVLGHEVSLESQVGVGTSLRIRVPRVVPAG